MNKRLNLSAVLSGFLAFLFLLFGGTMSAHAVAPLPSLDGLITDQAGVLGDQTEAITQAQEAFHAATGANFYVVFIDTFPGVTPQTSDADLHRIHQEWAAQTGQNAGLEARDLLLVVSPNDPGYWLEYGGDLAFTPEQSNQLDGVMSNSLTAGLQGTVPWQNAVANIIGAFQNEIVVDETTVQGTSPAPEGTQNDGAAPTATADPAMPTAPVETGTTGGLPTVARVVLIALAALAALFALWLLLGKYNEKRLAKRAEQNPFNL